MSEHLALDTGWLGRLAGVVEEAWDLALAQESPEVGTGLHDLHDFLVRTRQAQERVEELLAEVSLLRARAAHEAADADADLEDAWNEQARRPRRGFASDTAPRERYAQYSTATVAEQVEARRAEKRVRQLKAAEESVRAAHRRLEGTRWTTDARIRASSMDTRLER